MIVLFISVFVLIAKGASTISIEDEMCTDAITICQFDMDCVNRLSERTGFDMCHNLLISDIEKRNLFEWSKKRNDPTRLWSLLRKIDRIPSGK